MCFIMKKQYSKNSEALKVVALGTKQLDSDNRSRSNQANSQIGSHSHNQHNQANPHNINNPHLHSQHSHANQQKLLPSALNSFTAFSKKQITNFNQRSLTKDPHMQDELGQLVKNIIASNQHALVESIFIELVHRLKKTIDTNASMVRGRTVEKTPIPALSYLPIFYCAIEKKHILKDSNAVLETLCHILVASSSTTGGPGGPGGGIGPPGLNMNLHVNMGSNPNSKMTESKQSLIFLVCNIIMAIYNDVDTWPPLLIKCWLEDVSSSERTWTEDTNFCHELSNNIKTAFNAKYPEVLQDSGLGNKANLQLGSKNLGSHNQAPRQSPTTVLENNTPDTTAESSHRSSPVTIETNLLHTLNKNSSFTIKPRYPNFTSTAKLIDNFVDYAAKHSMSGNQNMNNSLPSKNIIKTLFFLTKFEKVQLFITPLLETWLLTPKLSRCSQDLLISLSLNLKDASDNVIALINKHIIEQLPKKLISGHSAVKSANFNNQIYSMVWRSITTFFSNASNCNEKVAECIVMFSFREELLNAGSTLQQMRHNHLSNLNFMILTQIIFSDSRESGHSNYIRKKLANFILEQVWTRKRPAFDKIKDLMKTLIIKSTGSNMGSHTSSVLGEKISLLTPTSASGGSSGQGSAITLGQSIIHISENLITNFKKFDTTNPNFSTFLALILELQISFLTLLAYVTHEKSSTPSNQMVGNIETRDEHFLDLCLYKPASQILESIVRWITHERNNLNSLKILTVLQKPFFLDPRAVNDNEFNKYTPIVLKLCKEIPINGSTIITLFRNLVVSKASKNNIESTKTNLLQVIQTIDQLSDTRLINFSEEEVEELVKVLLFISFYEGNEKIVIGEVYWYVCEFLVLLSEKSVMIKNSLFKMCFGKDGESYFFGGSGIF